MKYYKKNKKNIDLVIDQCNAHRFFTKFYVPKKKRIFYTHQLSRELWFVMADPPISFLGYAAETPMLRLNRNDQTITVSESTKQGLLDVGYKDENIKVLRQDCYCWEDLIKIIRKMFCNQYAKITGLK